MPVKQTGGIYIDGSNKFGGGIITDLSISVNLEQGSTASVTVVPDDCDADKDGAGINPSLSASRFDTYRIGITNLPADDYEGSAETEIYSADFNLIEKRTESGSRGVVYKYEFQEAGPLYLARAQVVIRGIHVPPDAGAGGSDIMVVGEGYVASTVAQGALIKLEDISDDAEDKLLHSSLLGEEAKLRGTQFLYTGYELAKAIDGAGVPLTVEAYNALRYGTQGMLFSTGGPLINVLNEIGGTLGILFVWSNYDSEGYRQITSGGRGYGISILTSSVGKAASNNAGAPIIQSSTTETLRGTFAKGASFRIEALPNDPLNQIRGIAKFETFGGDADPSLTSACGGSVDLFGDTYFRADGSAKDINKEQFELLQHYVRLVNAVSLGPDFFRFYVYMKMIAFQRSVAEYSDNEDFTETWLMRKNPLGRNYAVERLFNADADKPVRGCLEIASAEYWADADQAKDKQEAKQLGNTASHPWMDLNEIDGIVQQAIETNEALRAAKLKGMKSFMALAYLKEQAGDANLLNPASLNNYHRVLLDELISNEREFFVAVGPEPIYCERKITSTPTSGGLDETKQSTFYNAAWRQDTTFYSNPAINKVNPWLTIDSKDPWYHLIKKESTAADWKKFNDSNIPLTYAIGIAFLLGKGSLTAVATTLQLDCPAKIKTAEESKEDNPDDWACDPSPLELLPNGVLGLATEEGFAAVDIDEYNSVLAGFMNYFSDSMDGKDNALQRKASDQDVALIIVPAFGNGPPGKEDFTYVYQEKIGTKNQNENIYKTKTKEFEIDQDTIDKVLDEELPFKISDIGQDRIGARRFGFTQPGDVKYFYGINLAGADQPALSISNSANEAEIGEAFGDTRSLEAWSRNIKSIRCDGKVKQGGGFGGEDGKEPGKSVEKGSIQLAQSTLGGKEFIINDNLAAKANGASTWNQQSATSTTTTYAGVPNDIPSSNEGLQTLNFQMTSQGITTTVGVGNRAIAISFKKMAQFTTLRNHLIAAGYDSVADAFGTKFRANTFDPIAIPKQGFTASRPAGSNAPF